MLNKNGDFFLSIVCRHINPSYCGIRILWMRHWTICVPREWMWGLRMWENSNLLREDISIFWDDTVLPQRNPFKMVVCGHSMPWKAHWKGIYSEHRVALDWNRGPYSGFLHRCYSHPNVHSTLLRVNNKVPVPIIPQWRRDSRNADTGPFTKPSSINRYQLTEPHPIAMLSIYLQCGMQFAPKF